MGKVAVCARFLSLVGVLGVTWFFEVTTTWGQTVADVQLAVLQYRGGGDWYSNPTAVPNLVRYCNEEMGMRFSEDVPYVDVASPDLFNHPWIHMTGHGNVVFSAREAAQLRSYLESGGFLHISDNYGMDAFVRAAMAKVFPDLEWIEVPLTIRFITRSLIFRRACPKSTSTTTCPPVGLGCS